MAHRIGPYEIVKTLGQGGMGVVYLAKQQAPIERLVALKVVRFKEDNERLKARFEAERRALARLNHVNVAQVYDTGTSEDGAPYIVMEHVPGEPVTTFCRSRQATIGERVAVFIDVCKGVQHVHQKGLIHRDLKPPNILVVDADGTWIPKIIDFGIAKGFDSPLSDDDLTQDQLVGTPLYIAPEALRGQDQDTRADVYALGLVLYRLLIGVKPVPKNDSENFLEMVQNLAKGEAVPTLTRRFQQLDGQEQERVGRDRGIEPRSLARAFARDLDWIVMKAIRADPDARYQTPLEFAADLQRFLDGEPVSARPPSLAYIGAKTVSKHRWPVAGAGLLVATMVIGTLSTAYQARNAYLQTQLAEASAEQATQRQLEAEQVADMLSELFSAANPFQEAGQDPTVRDLLDRAATTLAARDLPPLVRAKLLLSIADAYSGLSELEAAHEALEQAIAILEEAPAGNEEGFAVAVAHLAQLDIRMKRFDPAGAGAERALAILDAAPDAAPVARPSSLLVLSILHEREGAFDQAIDVATEALEALDAQSDVDPSDASQILSSLARYARRNSDFDDCKAYLDEALNRLERDPNDLNVIAVMQDLAKIQFITGQTAEAIAGMEQAREIAEERLGPDHNTVVNMRLNTAVMNSQIGNLDAAEVLFRGVVEAVDTIPAATRMLSTLHLASIELQRGNAAESEALCRTVAEDTTGQIDVLVQLDARVEMGEAIAAQGRFAEAEDVLRDSLERLAQVLGPTHPTLEDARTELSEVYEKAGRLEDAIEIHERHIRDRTERVGIDHKITHSARIKAGRALAASGEYERAEAHLRRALEGWEHIEDPSHRAGLLDILSKLLVRTGREAEAEELAKRTP